MDAADELRFLESLTPEQALRYKALSGPLSSHVVRDMVEPMLPPMLSTDASERLSVALAAAAKMFAVDVVEEARRLQEAHAMAAGVDVSRSSVEPAHLLEAYRRMALEGRVLLAGGGPAAGDGNGARAGPGGVKRGAAPEEEAAGGSGAGAGADVAMAGAEGAAGRGSAGAGAGAGSSSSSAAAASLTAAGASAGGGGGHQQGAGAGAGRDAVR